MFAVEVVSPPSHLPVTAADATLAAAVTEELERTLSSGVASSRQTSDGS